MQFRVFDRLICRPKGEKKKKKSHFKIIGGGAGLLLPTFPTLLRRWQTLVLYNVEFSTGLFVGQRPFHNYWGRRWPLLPPPVHSCNAEAGLWRFRPNASSSQEVSSRVVLSHYKFVSLQVRTTEVSSNVYKMYIKMCL